MNMFSTLKQLDFERLAGTAGERQAIDVISAQLAKLGLTPTLEEFEISGFDAGSAIITCKDKSWEATPYGLCPDTEISGELVFLENADALMHSPGTYDDKIVLYYHSSIRLYELLEYSRVKAFIGISAPLKKAYSYSHRQNRDEFDLFPAVMIRYDYAKQLIKQAGNEIKLVIKQMTEQKTAHNIVVDIPGSGTDTNLTLLVGHYDTVARSHGACDNGGGSVCLLKAAEYFTKHKPLRDLRIVWFSGEELGLLGSYAYVDAHLEEIKKRLRLVVNVDLAGDPIGKNMMIVLGTKQLMGYAGGILKESGLLFHEDLSIYSSDGMPFTPYEIPSLNLARFGGEGLFHIHTEDDTVKHNSEAGLRDVYQATVNILERVLNAHFYPTPKAIDDSLRDKIESYLWQSQLKKPELKWREKYKK